MRKFLWLFLVWGSLAASFVLAEPPLEEEASPAPASEVPAQPERVQSDYEIEMGGIDSYAQYSSAKDKILGALPRRSFFVERRLQRGKNLLTLKTSATPEEVRKSFETIATVMEADEGDQMFKVHLR